jgi:hypothetical protein
LLRKKEADALSCFQPKKLKNPFPLHCTIPAVWLVSLPFAICCGRLASGSLGAKPVFFANYPPIFPYVLRYVKILLAFVINYIKHVQKAVFFNITHRILYRFVKKYFYFLLLVL